MSLKVIITEVSVKVHLKGLSFSFGAIINNFDPKGLDSHSLFQVLFKKPAGVYYQVCF